MMNYAWTQLLAVVLIVSPAMSQGMLSTADIALPYTVEDVRDDGYLVLGAGTVVIAATGKPFTNTDRLGTRRLWGVTVDIAALRDLTLGKTVNCKPGVPGYDMPAPDRSLYQCFLLPESPATSDTAAELDVGRILISSGKGIEICDESGNWYGTCKR